MKSHRTHNFSLLLAALVGVVLWFVTSIITHKREPWDDSYYWIIVYPLAIAAATVLAFRYPQKPVLLTLVVFESQFLAMCVRNAELGNLWPLGMVLFGVIALPGILTASIAAKRSPYRRESGGQA